MPRLIFNDGRQQRIDYNTGARIHQMLIGNETPKNSTQAWYLMQLKEVRFEKLNI